MSASATPDLWAQADALAESVRAAGERIGLPYIAAHSDFGDPEPMRGKSGAPYGKTHFQWIDPRYEYWLNRRLALESPFLKAARLISEPFFYAHGRLAAWRPTHWLDGIDLTQIRDAGGDYGAIIAPVHLPKGVIGAIVWAGRGADVAAVYQREAEGLAAVATRFLSAHQEAKGALHAEPGDLSLTRREVQCLKWAAAGKTDLEVGLILGLSISTVRFHLRNAAAKLGANGRAQVVQLAVGLGYIGAR